MRDFTRQVYKGRTLGRILQNRSFAVVSSSFQGRFVDIAGGRGASYLQYLPLSVTVETANRKGVPADKVADFNQPLPFPDGLFDGVLFMNALYILEDRASFWRECTRVLKKDGILIVGAPFIANEMPEPHDYARLTAEGLEKELTAAGFADIRVIRLGERFSAAAHLLHPAFLFNTVRLVVYAAALLCDRLIPARAREAHPTPIGYLATARTPRI